MTPLRIKLMQVWTANQKVFGQKRGIPIHTVIGVENCYVGQHCDFEVEVITTHGVYYTMLSELNRYFTGLDG